MKPPTTPPAIAPEVELLCEVGVGVGVDDELDPPLGVKVDWETVTADVGTMETVPVTSGESRHDKCLCVQDTAVSYLLRFAPSRYSSCHRSVRCC